MRTTILLAAALTMTGCTTPAKKPDQTITTPRTRTLLPFSPRIKYPRTYKETPGVGNTVVEGERTR